MRLASLAFFVIALLVSRNLHLFSQPIYEDGDFAANSLLIADAKRGTLFHGNYSRVGFFHPGPALLTVMALAELVFHDTLGWTPAPHNAHILGCLILSGGLIGLASWLLALVTNQTSLGWLLLPIALAFFGWTGNLDYHWFPCLYCLIYFALQMAAWAVAVGRPQALPWLALTAGLAVHGHVSFVLFVAVLSGLALLPWLLKGARLGRFGWWAAAVATGFAAPIVIHSLTAFPGEIWRYVGYARARPGETPSLSETINYVLRVITDEQKIGYSLALLSAGLLLVTAFWGRRSRWLAVIAIGSAGCVFYYAWRGVDDFGHTYIIRFARTLLILGPVALLCSFRRTDLRWAFAAAVACIVIIFTGRFENFYRGDPQVAAIAERLARDTRWQERRAVLTLEYTCWPQVAGLIVQLERRGRVPAVLNPAHTVLFAARHRATEADLAGEPWLIDIGRSDSGSQHAQGWESLTIREIEIEETSEVIGGERLLDILPAFPRGSAIVPMRLPAGPITLSFETLPYAGRPSALVRDKLAVFVGNTMAGIVTYSRDRATPHHLAVESPGGPTLIRFESLTSGRLFPSRSHFHTVRLTKIRTTP